MANTTRYVHREPVPERVGWEYTGLIWTKKHVTRIPAAAFTALTVRIDTLAGVAILAATNILNTGRGTLVEAQETVDGVLMTVTRLTIAFEPTDSLIVDAASEINIEPRERVPGERHQALVEGTYQSSRLFAREIQWPVVNFAKRT